MDNSLKIQMYKSPDAYASLYKSYGRTVDGIREDDVTVIIIREVWEARNEGSA